VKVHTRLTWPTLTCHSLGVCVGLLTLAAALAAPAAAAPRTERVSVSSSERQGNGPSTQPLYRVAPTLSRTGRFVVFTSDAGNLVPRDTNGHSDVFVRDRKAGTTRRVSLTSKGAQANRRSIHPSISSSGRYVAFQSQASLARGDRGSGWDVYVRDLKLKKTTLVSIRPNGVHRGDEAAISGDGRSVVFQSRRPSSIKGLNKVDVLVRHLGARRTERVTVSPTGEGAASYDQTTASISGNGRFVAFDSFANNLVAGDDNGTQDVFVRDLKRHATTRIGGNGTISGSETTSDPAMSGNGRFVTFNSNAPEITGGDDARGWFRRDLKTGATLRLLSGFPPPHFTVPASLSDNGNIVVFGTSDPDNHMSAVFVHDVAKNTTTRVSVGTAGQSADDYVEGAAISGDGRFAGFSTSATNLVSGDTNDTQDVFVRGPLGP
jgi:Tol biopolymer transport system component